MESVSWQSAHYEEPYASQRRAKLGGKLAKLGVLDLDRNAAILDTCCGRGDALDLLLQRGFRNIQGVDGTPHPDWAKAAYAVHQADVRRMPFDAGSFDVVMNLHALHHLGDARGVADYLVEVQRVLKPGGKLLIIDFPASPQIKLVFFLLRKRVFVLTGGLDNFARIVDEEWSYLSQYLEDWSAVRQVLHHGPLPVERCRQEFFLYYLTLGRNAG